MVRLHDVSESCSVFESSETSFRALHEEVQAVFLRQIGSVILSEALGQYSGFHTMYIED